MCDEHAEADANTDNSQLLPSSLPNGAKTLPSAGDADGNQKEKVTFT